MDLGTTITSMATTMSQQSVSQQASVAILKRALDIQTTSSLQLIDGINNIPSASNLPDNLGQNINTSV
jgi:hypothetical protein